MAADWDRVVELTRISQENPAAAAVLRLHWDNDGAGSCSECTGEYGAPWPCPTVLAIEKVATQPKPLVFDPDAVKLAPAPIGPWLWEWPPVVTADQLPGHPLVNPSSNPVAPDDSPVTQRGQAGQSTEETP